jgi:hypothetical protein
LISRRASLASVVVLPTPFTPTIRKTVGGVGPKRRPMSPGLPEQID